MNKKAKAIKKAIVVLFVVLILISSFKFLIIKPKNVFADSRLGFNEGYGTTVNDNNSNISGTITNAVWNDRSMCKIGKCLYFDGTGDLVNFGDDADLDHVASDNFTLEGWFRTPDITSGTRVLISKYNSATGTDGGYKVYMDSNGYLIFGIDDDQTSFPEDSASTSTTSFDDNKWHFFSAVKTGTTSITLYVDGIQYQTDSTISSTGTLANSDTYYIGIDGDGSSNGFSGFLDEITIRNSARSTTEIKTDYLETTQSRGVSASFSPDTSHLSDGLVGYWKMDESSGNATDYSGSGLTLTNNGTTPFASGKFYNASGTFNGTTRYFSTTTSVPNVKSILLWVYPSSTTNNFFNLASGKYLTSSSGTLSLSGFSSDAKIYVNGIISQTITANTWQMIAITDTTGITADTIRFGQANGSYYANGGYIDEIRIYNKTLASNDILSLYSWAPPAVGYWDLDENSGTTAFDKSGLGNDLTLTNTPRWVQGKFNSAILFSGSNQHLLRSDDSDFDIGASGSATWETWFKHSTASAQEIILSKFNTFGYKLIMESDGDLTCGLDFGLGSWVPNDTATSTLATYDDSNWHHVACVKDASNSLNLYIDGTLVASDSAISNTTTLENIDPLYIGIDDDGTSNDFTGTLDNVQIYNYARSASQIIEDMNQSHPAPGSPVGSSVAYWKLDEGYGTTAYDNSVNANNLTLSTASWTTNGKFSNAFNGLTNVRMSRTDDSDLDFDASEDLTFSFWFKSDSATNPSANEYLLEKGGNITTDAIGYAIYTSSASDGLICFGIDDDATNFPEDSVCSASDLYDNTWHHIVATKTGTTRLDLYIDGKANGTPDTSISATGTLANASTFYIGDTNGTDGTDEFLGDIDEIKVFRSALNSDAVKLLFNQNASASMGASSTDSSNNPSNSALNSYCPPGQGTTCVGPFAHYDFNANSGTPTTLYDKSGNNFDGTIAGSMTSENWVTGAFGSGLKFDGVNDLANIYSASFDTSFDENVGTISLWLKFNATEWADTSDTRTAIQIAADTNNYVSIRKTTTANTLAMVYSGSATSDNHQYVSSRTDWFNVTMVWDKPNEYFDVYIDGVLVDHNTALGVWSGAVGSTRANIGARLSDGTNPFFGQIDDVQIYNYARTPAQIAWGYNMGKPTSWWRFDENSGSPTTLGDATISRSDGTASGSMDSSDWLTGKFNSSLDFDGSDDVVTVTNADPIDLNINLFAGFTFATWIYPNSDGENDAGRIFQKGSNGNTTDSSSTFCRTSGESGGRVDITCSVNLDTTETNFTVSSAVAINTWSHIAFSWTNDSDDEVTIWINGIPYTSTASYSGDPAADTADLYIAGNGTTTSNTRAFDGQIDDFRIYNYEVNQKQIKSIMLNNATVKY